MKNSLLKRFAENLGSEFFGVADISGMINEIQLPSRVIDGLNRAVVIGVRLSTATLEDISDTPTQLYFRHYRSANVLLDQISFRIGAYIQQKNYRAVAIPASQVLDWKKQTAHLSHKKLAVISGLGWIGRNNLLVNEKAGSQLRLAAILTDMPLRITKPSKRVKKGCAQCYACVMVCPAKAIKEDAAHFDHQACFEKLKEFHRKRLAEQFICGVCVNACKGRVR